MSEYLEPKQNTKSDNNEYHEYQSFSKNNILNSSNDKNLRTHKKEDLLNFSFKKDLISSNNDQKLNELNIYSKNDKNINKSGHFAKIKEKKIKKKDIEYKFINPDSICLKKTLFQENDNSIKYRKQNDNKENLNLNNNNNYNNKYYCTIGGNNGDNVFEKIKTKIKILRDANNGHTFNNNKNNNNKIKQIKNNSVNKRRNIKYIKKDTNNNNNKAIKNRNKSLEKKVIKINDKKIFKSFNTNTYLRNNNLRLANLNNTNNTFKTNFRSKTKENIFNTSNSYLNYSFEDNEKKITDLLLQKIKNINRKILLFSEYNKKLKKQLKNLNQELSSYEKNQSKRKNRTDRNSNKFIKISPYYRKNRSVLCSDIRKMILMNKFKDSKVEKRKNKTSLFINKNKKGLFHKDSNNNSFISEFSIKSNKKNQSININVYKNIIDRNDIRKRRIKTKIFDYIHIK